MSVPGRTLEGRVFGTPEDIAPLAFYLASDEANSITGQAIGADGGGTML